MAAFSSRYRSTLGKGSAVRFLTFFRVCALRLDASWPVWNVGSPHTTTSMKRLYCSNPRALVLLRMATHSAWSGVGGTAVRFNVTATSSPAANGRGVTSMGGDSPSYTFPSSWSSRSASLSPASSVNTRVNRMATRQEPAASGLVSRVARIRFPPGPRVSTPAVTVVAPSSAMRVSCADSGTGPRTVHSTVNMPWACVSAVSSTIPLAAIRSGWASTTICG